MADPTPAAARTRELADLAREMLAQFHLPATPHHMQLFGRVYRHFLEVVPPHQRERERLEELFRASVGLPPPRQQAAAEAEAEIARLAGRVAELEAQARAWEAERRALERSAGRGRAVVARVFEELGAQLAAERRALAEREARLRAREAELEQRLARVQEAERRLLPRLEAGAAEELAAVLGLEVEALRGELAEVAEELAEVVAEQERLEGGAGGSPLAQAVRRLKEQAQAAGIDALTGLAGRALFERDLAHALAGCSRRRAAGEAAPLAAVFVDLDGFKGVNDTHGHAAGDAALRAVAGVLEGRLRESDRAYRLGGDEFLLLLAETDAAGAAHLAEEVRDAIRELAVAVDGGATVRLTASLGVADTESAGLAVVACADAALYRAKREGGDRIVTYRDDAFVEPLPPGLPDSFLGPLRQRLDRGEPITVAALHPGEGEMAELRRQAQALFPGAVAAECDGDLLLLVEGADAEEAAARLAEGIHGVSAAAGATDLSEIPAEDAASPAARIAALVNTPLALAREAA